MRTPGPVALPYFIALPLFAHPCFPCVKTTREQQRQTTKKQKNRETTRRPPTQPTRNLHAPRTSTCETRAKATNQVAVLLLAPSMDPVTPSTSCGSPNNKNSKNSQRDCKLTLSTAILNLCLHRCCRFYCFFLNVLFHLFKLSRPFGGAFRLPAAFACSCSSLPFYRLAGVHIICSFLFGTLPDCNKAKQGNTEHKTLWREGSHDGVQKIKKK